MKNSDDAIRVSTKNGFLDNGVLEDTVKRYTQKSKISMDVSLKEEQDIYGLGLGLGGS